MSKFQVGLTGVIIFGAIGAFFGSTGFAIGVVLGIITGFAHDPEEEERKKLAKEKALQDKKQKENPETPKPQSFKSTQPTDPLYEEVVAELIAACVTSDGKIEESEIELATALIESDEFIGDKLVTLNLLKEKIDKFLADRNKSKAVFNLSMTSVIHKVKKIQDELHKERILVILDGMLDSIKEGDVDLSSVFVEKVKSVISTVTAQDPKQQAAEEYILKSGDREAIAQLREMQKDPRTYGQRLKEAAKGNSVMKTALGVFTGMIAANLVTSAIHQYQLEQALNDFNTQIDSAGGLENMDIGSDSGLNTASYDSSFETSANCSEPGLAEFDGAESLSEVDAAGLDVPEDIGGVEDLAAGDSFDFFS